MRSHANAYVHGSRILTPTEINAELADLVGTAHSLDRDNFQPAAISEGKLAKGVWGNQLIVLSETLVQHAYEVGSGGDQYHWLPDDGTGPDGRLIKPFTSGDGGLMITLSCDVRDNAGTVSPSLWIGVLVDGALVAQSPQAGFWIRHAPFCQAHVPVGAGVRLIEAIYGFGDTYTSGSARTIDFRDRVLHVREVAR